MNEHPTGIAAETPDPITPPTKSEEEFIEWLNRHLTREEVLERLKVNLQTAIDIELATIPIYLFTYYSIIRDTETGESIGDSQLFANKAGGVIMSVAVEEMLHMSLSSNILFATGGQPELYQRAPGHYPTPLPYHDPKGPPGPDGSTAVRIPLRKLGFDQLWHFLQIEYPEEWNALPQDYNWQTIGQFYSYIRCLIRTRFVTDDDFRLGAYDSGIQPYNYSPNNIDTVYPSQGFDPCKPAPPAPAPGWAGDSSSAADVAQYPDQEDSHAGQTQLLCVRSRKDAADAIDTICDQGEGRPVPDVGSAPTDDLSKDEDSHYVKFLKLQAQFDRYAGCREKLADQPPPPEPVEPAVSDEDLAPYVCDFPDNPVNIHYPDGYRAIAEFNSALFQYMLIMVETIYRVPPDRQKLFFNEGLHRSMIWVMDKYIRTIRGITIPSGRYRGKVMAPTFENVDLGPRSEAFAGLTAFGNAAIDAANAIALAHPGTPLAKSMGSVVHYVGVALTQTDGAAPMHLPDVGPYWIDVD